MIILGVSEAGERRREVPQVARIHVEEREK
jgi:hypothetical protein